MRKLAIKFLVTTLLFSIGLYLFLQHESASNSSKQLSEYEKYSAERIAKKKVKGPKTDSPDIHALIQRELRTREGASSPEYGANQVMEEFEKAQKRLENVRSIADEFDFIERGPGNVAGRTRSILLDPDDATGNTWYAGSASGGIWKTSDAGGKWNFISGDIPNLGTNTLAMSPANTQIIYAGTGEHFTNDIDGAGLFKSSDKGATWQQVANPSDFPDFKNISRIVVDPNDANTVIVASRNSVWSTTGFQAAIYKTTDGGINWTRIRSSESERYDDIAFDPTDFNTLYVAVQRIGVIKSIDGGSTWSDASLGMNPGGRVEIAISPVNGNRLWASVQGGLSGNGSDLYVTSDGAATWTLAVNATGTNEDFLGGQGWYDNYATAHPFDEDIVYVGGVNNWKFELGTQSLEDIPIIDVSEDGTDVFMSYINFGAPYFGGALDIGVPFDQLRPIEIRFGQGTQLAHRFTVNGQGSGVPSSGYLYQDYVEVPFQVWDNETNTQLMVSFRDQQEDGAWNLIPSNTSGDGTSHSREYLYIHDVEYSQTADADIAQNGGVDINQLYFFWSVLTPAATFDPATLPNSNLIIELVQVPSVERITTNVSDAYGDFGGPNAFPQSARTAGIHPDQHNSIITDVDEANGTFRIMITNDGGVYQSVSSNDPGPNEGDFEYVSYGYNTTQFYGADKAPGEDRFIGGMQDNGTWYHPAGTTGSADASARFGIGGDGFESLWHATDINKLIGGSQYNNFAKTTNGGTSWVGATSGFDDDGPFVTRLANNKSTPDVIFTVGALGVWKSMNFGDSWSASSMADASGWASSFTNNTDVEVSYANPNVIWAGARLSSAGRLHVSTDGGDTFDPVENYDLFNMGSVSGIGTHPAEKNTAYALFSFSGYPKVIKTTDLGQNWVDISGFDGSGDRGFPDVAVNTLFVFPTDNNRIWVGTEIGIVESLDGGASWNLLQSNFPAVNVYDFKLSEDVLVIATYGRGIWSVKLDFPSLPILTSTTTSPLGELSFSIDFPELYDSTEIYVDNQYLGAIYENAAGSVVEKIENIGIEGFVSIKLDSYKNGNRFSVIKESVFVLNPNTPEESYATTFDEVESNFVGLGFDVVRETGFDSKALHSEHLYKNQSELFTILKTPIIVGESGGIVTYSDVAIVEPGDAGSTFGQPEFNDYVTVEGSLDGENWVTLKGYDASLYPEWAEAYINLQKGSPSLLKTQSINLLDHFDQGDIILMRFRLYANDNEASYGWAITDLYIQEEKPLATVDLRQENISIFPNPIVGRAEIRLHAELLDNTIRVYNASGKVMDVITVKKDQKTFDWTPSGLEKGIYFLRFNSSQGLVSKKVYIN